MTELDRVLAGIRCREVLEELSAYLDAELPPARAAQIEAHLRACDRCERFGGRFARIVQTIRQALARPEPLDPEVARRLRDRLARLASPGAAGP
jgi:anti-sigma factor RsiW